jgi:uncharacterized protein YcbX
VTEQQAVGRVERIWIYPVKSLAGRSLDTVDLLPAGPAGDRAWAVVDAGTGQLVRGKHAPGLAGLVPTGEPDVDARVIGQTLGRPVRLAAPVGGTGADVAAVHLVSQQAIARAEAGEVPEGCSADDPRANLLLSLPGADERDWVGRELRVGEAVLRLTRTPKHCLGVYADVVVPGPVRAGDPVLLVEPHDVPG